MRTAIFAAALMAMPAAHAVNKCTLDGGRVVYQDALCPAAAGASQVRLFTPQSDPAGRQRAAADMAAAAKLEKAAELVPAPAPAIGLGPATPAQMDGGVAELADACLNQHRAGLRDPRSAYWRNASLDKFNVLRMTLHATNGYGGFVTNTVECEMRNGKLR